MRQAGLIKSQLRSGFSLIELIVVIAISGILSITLYFAFEQARKSVVNIDRIIDSDQALLLFYNQIDKDISAAFVPQIVYEQVEAERKKEQEKNQAVTQKPDLAQK